MPELIVFGIDRSAGLTPQEYAESYKLYDLIEVRPDGWNWSDAELGHPNFRILKWPDVVIEQEFMTPIAPMWKPGPLGYPRGIKLTHFQPRRWFLDWSHPAARAVAPKLAVHFAHRNAPHYLISAPATLLVTIRTERPAISVSESNAVA
jgi:hypothetical protein